MSQISLLSNSSWFNEHSAVNDEEDIATANRATINQLMDDDVDHIACAVDKALSSPFKDNQSTNACTLHEEEEKLYGAFKALGPGNIQSINGYAVTPIISVDSSANSTDNVCMMVDLLQMVLFKWSQIDVWLRKSKSSHLIILKFFNYPQIKIRYQK